VIKTIIFDLGKVLIPFDFSRGYKGMEELSGLPAAEIRTRIASTDLVHRLECGLIEPAAFVRQLSALLGCEVGYDRFAEIWSSIFLPGTLLPDSLIEALHRKYRMLVLSNTNAIHFEMVREHYPILRHFDHYTLSHEVQAMKPDPRIYRAVLAEARCLPGECFYTDDIADYVEAAKGHGIDAVLFQSQRQIEAEMQDRGIVW
jgi:glucose-1-phosphatase